MKSIEFFQLPDSLKQFAPYFSEAVEPWEWLNQIKPALANFFSEREVEVRDDIPPGLHISGPVFIHPSVTLPPYGVIEGPAFIGPETELRPGVYIRGNVIAGKGCVMGNSCEYKNSLLMDQVETAHFNYVGDSILGNKAHLGAGVILANIRLDRKNITIKTTEGILETGRRKIGGILGDKVEVSCNSVIQPGTMIGRGSYVLMSPTSNQPIPAKSVIRPSKK